MATGISLGRGRIKEVFGLFLSRLLQDGKVRAIVGLSRSSANSASYIFTVDPERAKEIDPFLPDYPVQGAYIVKQLTFLTPSNEKVLFIMRPCEIRAVVELFKLNQLKLDNLYFLSMDCLGALKSSYILRNGLDDGDSFIGGSYLEDSYRRACGMCEDFVPGEGSDLRLSVFNGEVKIFALTNKGKEIVGDCVELDEPDWSELKQKRTLRKSTEYDYFDRKIRRAENLFNTFAACINCHNCMRVCPICYCQECFFDSTAMRYEAEKFLGLGIRMKNVRVPYDTLLFHIGRLNHMVVSCVACGACEEGCPREIPVSLLFKRVGEQVQTLFNYKPGRSFDEELPLKTFREDELEPV